jgi:hypothetical protein
VVDNEQIMKQIEEEMRPAIERANKSNMEHAAKVNAELQKEMKAICEKHGVRAQDFAGLPGPKLLQMWSDFFKDHIADYFKERIRSEDETKG